MGLIQAVKQHYNTLAVFPYGSTVYLNKEPDDYDFIIVSDSDFQEKIVINGFDCEITSYTKDEFLKKLHTHDIALLECLFIDHPEKQNLISETEQFCIDLSALRESISQKSSNSYVKAKKKLILEDDFDENVSLKSLWHSLRIADFGYQLAKHGRIVDVKSVNKYYKEIRQDYLDLKNDWSAIHAKYKPIHNKLMSEFRSICPKKA